MGGGERVLSPGELNRALLARQLLLERSPLPVPEALEQMGGLQAQYAPAMYIGLWSRVAGLERPALTRLLEERAVVQATLLRATIHLVSRADYWPLALAIRDARRRWWLRVQPAATRPTEEAILNAAATLRAAFAERGPLRQKEIDALLGPGVLGAVSMWLDLVRVPPSGTWERRRADLYDSAERWLGPAPDLAPDDALDHLVRRYLTGFGPARPADVATWAGLDTKTIAPALDRVAPRRFHDETGAVLFDIPDGPLPPAATPAPVRFLATWDAMLLVHARGKAVLPEDFRPIIFTTKLPQSMPTFLVDGVVAGGWRHEAGRIQLHPFRPLSTAEQRAVRAEADRLAEFHRD